MLDYYIVTRGYVDPVEVTENVKNKWMIYKYSGHRDPDTTGIVREFKDGRFDSDDYGFARHGKENASKRINMVKLHLELGEPNLTAYWNDDNGRVDFHTMKIV